MIVFVRCMKCMHALCCSCVLSVLVWARQGQSVRLSTLTGLTVFLGGGYQACSPTQLLMAFTWWAGCLRGLSQVSPLVSYQARTNVMEQKASVLLFSRWLSASRFLRCHLIQMQDWIGFLDIIFLFLSNVSNPDESTATMLLIRLISV